MTIITPIKKAGLRTRAHVRILSSAVATKAGNARQTIKDAADRQEEIILKDQEAKRIQKARDLAIKEAEEAAQAAKEAAEEQARQEFIELRIKEIEEAAKVENTTPAE